MACILVVDSTCNIYTDSAKRRSHHLTVVTRKSCLFISLWPKPKGHQKGVRLVFLLFENSLSLHVQILSLLWYVFSCATSAKWADKVFAISARNWQVGTTRVACNRLLYNIVVLYFKMCRIYCFNFMNFINWIRCRLDCIKSVMRQNRTG